MKIKTIFPNYFNPEGHLTEEHITLYSEAIVLDKVEQIPSKVLDHVEQCVDCKAEVVELYQLIKKHESLKVQDHPYFGGSNIIRSGTYLKLAAIFLGLVGVSLILYYSLGFQKSYQQLFTDNFTPYENLITIKGDGETKRNSILNITMSKYYSKRDYESTRIVFENIYQQGENDENILFYLGNSYLATGECILAQELFMKLSQDITGLFYQQSKWYLALAYLCEASNSKGDKQNELISESRKVLLSIINEHSSYSRQAKKLITRL